eukprot:c17839_g1_i1 orf=322-966(-)
MEPTEPQSPTSSSACSHQQDAAPERSKSAATARSCKGFLYYSSQMKANARNPLCVGFSRSEERVRNHSASDAQHDPTKEGRDLLDFKYLCMGYSAHQDAASSSGNRSKAELPLCTGVELLAERKVSQVTTASKQEHNDANDGQRNNEGAPVITRPPSLRPPNTLGGYSAEEFGSRFIHNAGLIASAIGNNLSRLGSYIKSGLDDMIYPDRRRPK